MAARSSMADLISRVRTMIADTATTQQFTDQQIQEKLDEHRDDVIREMLEAAPSFINPSGGQTAQYVYADYYSSHSNWESDAVIQGQNVETNAPWIVLTPVASDWIVGHFQFQTDVFTSGVEPGQWPPVYISGKTYDLFAASADLLEIWATRLALKFDVIVGGQTFRRSQAVDNLRALAKDYRMKQKVKVGKMVRSDVIGGR